MKEKSVRVDTRVPESVIKLIKIIAEEHQCSVSDVVRTLIDSSLNNIDQSRITDELKLLLMKGEQKSVNSKLYIVKNMYKRILDMAMSSYFITRSINMKMINIALDLYVKAFDLYDEDIKKAIGTDFRLTVKRLRNENFLLEQSNTVRNLKMIERK